MVGRRVVRVAGLAGAALLCLLPPAAEVAAGTTCANGITRVSVSSQGVEANGISLEPTISGDGSVVAYFSDATNLVRRDTNGWGEIFVHELGTGRTRRVSLPDGGGQANWHSLLQDVSDDGGRVVFGSSASNLVATDTNDLPDTFVRDRRTGSTVMVSVSSRGVQGVDGGSGSPAISGDGSVVGFYSVASGLVRGDTNEAADVFVHVLGRGTTTRVSVRSDGAEADAQSAVYTGPALSRSGRIVAFESEATNLVPGDTNAALDVFVHDRRSGVTERISTSSAGRQGRGEAYAPSLSRTGRFVAFAADATNLVPGDRNGTWDIFVKDRRTGTTSLVSVATSGEQANGYSYSPTISASGRFVAFWSAATDLADGDGDNVPDVFVHDRRTGETRLVSIACDGGPADGESVLPSINDRGDVVTFETSATNLVAADRNGVNDIVVARISWP